MIYNIDLKEVSKIDTNLAPSQWETPLQSNAISYWLGANLESAGNILGLHPVNEGRRHKVTPSLTGWAQT